MGPASVPAWLVVDDDVEEGIVDFERVVAVVMDETEFTELVHEEADARPRGSDHFREYLLTDLGQNGLWPVVFTEVCQQEEHPSQPFLAGVEEVVYQVLFNATVPFEEVQHESSGKSRLG